VKIKIKIDGDFYYLKKEVSILEACLMNNIYIPTLCNIPNKKSRSVCRICSVEVKERAGLICSCSTKITDGMEIITNSDLVRRTQKNLMRFILNEHENCSGQDCEIENLALRLGVNHDPIKIDISSFIKDESSAYISIDRDRCIHCDRCIRSCDYGIIARGYVENSLTMGFERNFHIQDSNCVGCSDCIKACPAGVLGVYK